MQDMNYEELQFWSQQFYSCDYPQGLRIATGVNADPSDICQMLYGKELSACYTELLGTGAQGTGGLLNSRALLLDGTSGCWCTTPDAAALDIIADIDIRFAGVGTGGTDVNQTLIGKWGAAGQRSYQLYATFGLFRLGTSTDGTASLDQDISPQHFLNAYPAVRSTLDVVNGANKVHERFSGTAVDGTFTSLDADTTVGNTSIFASTAVLGIGAHNGGTANFFKGRVSHAQIRSSIGGTVVANPDFRALAPGTTNFVDSAGLTWTLQGTAKII